MSNISISSLFNPALSGVVPGNPAAVPATGTWLATLLANATTLQLPVTAWQSGGVARTILAIMANVMAQGDVVVSTMAQGGFLDFASAGTVTYTAANGQIVTGYVSPDPSIPSQNATGALGWLDLLADSVYNVQRIGAAQAVGVLAIANTSTSTYGPFTAGTYHAGNVNTGAGYSNTGSLTIAAASFVGGGVSAATNTSPIAVTTAATHGLTSGQTVSISGVVGNTGANGFFTVTVTSTTAFVLNNSASTGAYTSGGTVNVCTTTAVNADLPGTVGSAAAGSIAQTTTVLTGVTCANILPLFGQPWESNTSVANRCRLKLQSLSPNGPKGSYSYFALTAAQLLAAQTPAVQLSSPITRVTVTTSATTGIVTTTLANANGPVPGVSNLAVTGATNASPIAITTATPHGLATNNFVTIVGVLGNTNANGTFNITVPSANVFTLNGAIGSGAYTSGGTIDGGDLGEVDTILQSNCVSDDVTALTVSAVAQSIAISCTATVPQTQSSVYAAAAQTALAIYFGTLPIGGNATGVISYDTIVGILFTAGAVAGGASYVQNLTNVLVNGGTSDILFNTPGSVATLSPTPIVNIIGV